jgi:ribonucleoside-diphosphate reductase alpha chain
MSAETPPAAGDPKPKRPRRSRRNLPLDTRASCTTKFTVGGHKGYLTVDLYEDGSPCAVTIRLAKMGSTMHGVFEWLSSSISLGLQHGVPVGAFIADAVDMQFDPSGYTGRPEIPEAKSIADYVAKQLRLWFETAAPEVK